VFLARLAAAITTAIAEVAPEAAELPDTAPVAWIRRPRHAGCGDFATPAARRWAATTGVPTEQLAERIAARLRAVEGVVECQVTGDGFVNLRVDARTLAGIVRDIVVAGEAYGRGDQVGLEASVASPLQVPSSALADDMRYAHARMCGFLRNATAWGLDVDPAHLASDRDRDVLTTGPIRPLVCALAEFPAVIARSTQDARSQRTPQRRLNRYVSEVLELVCRFEDAGGILPKGLEVPSASHRIRLLVVDATRIVFANALSRCGLDAPTRW
jgi:arginyl-tRNA synthetase